MPYVRSSFLFVAVLGLAFSGFCNAVCADEPATVKAAIEAINARTRSIRSANVTVYQEARNGGMPTEGERELEDEHSDVIRRLNEAYLAPKRLQLAIKGNQLRFEQQRPIREGEANSTELFERTSVYNGQVGKELILDNGSHRPVDDRYGLGTIDDKDVTTLSQLISVAPLALATRPMKWLEGHGFDVNTAKFHRSRLNAEDEKSLIVLDFAGGSGAGVSYEVWLAAEQNSVPMRIACRDKELTKWQIDITATNSFDGVNLPTAWDITQYDASGKAESLVAARVSKAQINIDLHDAVFDLDFPEGTLVTDMQGPSQAMYIVMKDGSKRDITEAELNAGIPYRDLRDTSPELKISGRRYLLYATLAVIAILSILIGLKRLR